MDRNYTKVFLTEEDKDKLFFIPVTDSERINGIKNLKNKVKKHILAEGVIAVICMIIVILCSENFMAKAGIWLAAMIGLVFMVAVIVLEMIAYRSNIKVWKKKALKKVEVSIEKKFPVERETVHRFDEPDELRKFYPIEGKDIRTGYITKIYITKEDYENIPVGGIVSRNFL